MTPYDTLKQNKWVLVPLGIYIVIKYIDRGHRLTYDPFQSIQSNQMGT